MIARSQAIRQAPRSSALRPAMDDFDDEQRIGALPWVLGYSPEYKRDTLSEPEP